MVLYKIIFTELPFKTVSSETEFASKVSFSSTRTSKRTAPDWPVTPRDVKYARDWVGFEKSVFWEIAISAYGQPAKSYIRLIG